jgi:DUF4097 and DUF4098 domain-containing protein YvlB
MKKRKKTGFSMSNPINQGVKMKLKGLWIVILIIALMLTCGLIIGTAWFTFSRITNTADIPVGQILSGEIFVNNDVRAERNEEETISLGTEPITLVIENQAGDILIQGSQREDIFMNAKKVAWGKSEEDAQAALDTFSYEIIRDTDKITIRIKDTRESSFPENQINFKIDVPETINLDLQTSLGDLYAAEITGNISLENNFGSTTLMNILDGNINVVSHNGKTSLKNILVEDKQVKVEGDFGDIDLFQITAQEITCTSRNGIITAENLKAAGNVELSNDFGELTLREGSAKNLMVKNQNGLIDLNGFQVTETLTIASDFGAVELENVLADQYEITTKNGDVFLNNATNGSIKIISDFGNIDMSNIKQAQLDLETKNGSITFRGSLRPENHMIQTDFGNIILRLPANQSINFDIGTSFGTIQTEHEIFISGDVNKNHWVGKLNEGGGLLTIETENGNITLEKTIVEE